MNAKFWLDFGQNLSKNALNSAFQIVGLIALYVISRKLLNRLMDGLVSYLTRRQNRGNLPEAPRAQIATLQILCRSAMGYALVFVFGILVLQALGFNILPILTTAGAVGIAVALGAQKLFKDIISGFFLIVDDLFVIGDVVTIGGVTGTVREISLRITRIQDSVGRLHQFPNGDIGAVVNLSRNPIHESIEIGITATADWKAATEVIREAGEKLFLAQAGALKAAPAVQGVSAFTGTAITVRVSVVTAPEAILAEQMRVREAMRGALLAANIALA